MLFPPVPTMSFVHFVLTEKNAFGPNHFFRASQPRQVHFFLNEQIFLIHDSSFPCRTDDGDMFVVKDPDLFASKIIPQYFDHNKFSSFARQLNFYGFRKMQSKPIRNSDFDANTAKHVTFYNENFQRGRHDLLKKIQRSTRGGGTNPGQDQQREIQSLREKVQVLESSITEMSTMMDERMRRLELDMLARMEQMMLAMQQQQSNQLQLQSAAKGMVNVSNDPKAAGKGQTKAPGNQNNTFMGMDPFQFGNRATSIGSLSGFAGLGGIAGLGDAKNLPNGSGPTLPPHPKQKQLPNQTLPGALNLPNARLASLRGISNLTRGLSLSRGISSESQNTGLLSNTFEDKFLSMLMAGGDNKAALNQLNFDSMNPTPMADQMANFQNLLQGTQANTKAAKPQPENGIGI